MLFDKLINKLVSVNCESIDRKHYSLSVYNTYLSRMWKKKYLCRFFYLSCCSPHIFTKNQSRITNFYKSFTQSCRHGFALTIEIVLIKQQQINKHDCLIWLVKNSEKKKWIRDTVFVKNMWSMILKYKLEIFKFILSIVFFCLWTLM